MRAEQMVHEYQAMIKEMELLAFQIEQFRGITEEDVIEMMAFKKHHDADRVQTSELPDRTFSTAISYKKAVDKQNRDRLKYLMERYWYLKEETEFFKRCVALLPRELSLLMQGMVIEKKTWDELERELHVSRRTVGNHKREAMRLLNDSYRMRDDVECEFMCS